MGTIAWTLAGILAVGVSIGSAQPSARPTEVGWLGLFNQDLVQWLENENQLQPLCSAFTAESPEWYGCREEKLAPKVHVARLWAGPSERSAAAGSLLILATPGHGLRAFFVPVAGGAGTEFRPDMFVGDWGYGPHFHQTFVERRGTWFRLPEVPFPRGTWINAAHLGGTPEVKLLAVEGIYSSPLGDLFILGLDGDVLRARPEQKADKWCESGDPPPLQPSRELRIPVRELYTPTGHLVLRTKYTRGC